MSTPPAQALTLTSTSISTGAKLPLPALLRSTTRSGASEIDPLLAGVTVGKIITLSNPSRGDQAGTPETLDKHELLALETEDGTTLFIRTDALAEAIVRRQPEALTRDGAVDFSQFRDPDAAARGAVDVLWQTARVLHLPSDGILDEARKLAAEAPTGALDAVLAGCERLA
jgi:hypothetical protein